MRILRKIQETDSKTWIATIKYYVEYFSFYAVMMRIGIKSEIHDCTIQVAKFLRDKGILEGEMVEELEDSKDLRIKNQYNLKNKPVDYELQELRDFILEMKEVKDGLSEGKIQSLRSDIFK